MVTWRTKIKCHNSTTIKSTNCWSEETRLSKLYLREDACWFLARRRNNHWIHSKLLHFLCCSCDSVRWWACWHSVHEPRYSDKKAISTRKSVISSRQQSITILCSSVSHQKLAIMFLTYFMPSAIINDPKVGLNIRSRRVSMKLDLSGPTKQPYI